MGKLLKEMDKMTNGKDVLKRVHIKRSWEMRYLAGGDELAKDLGEDFLIGHSFVFLKEDWLEAPLVRSIVNVLGEDVSEIRREPVLFSLWGEGWLDVVGVSLKRRQPPKIGVLGIWTDRDLYRLGRDVVKAYLYAPYRIGELLEVDLIRENASLGRQSLKLDRHGLGTIELQGLPAGDFELRVVGTEAKASFRVAVARKETLNGQWIQSYLQQAGRDRWVLVFVLQLESFGAPLKGEVGINLIDEGRETKWPVSGEIFRTDGAGRVAGELPIVGIGPFSLEIHSLQDKERRCLLRVPLDEEEVEDPEELSPRMLRYLIKNWRWEPQKETSLLGFSFESVADVEKEDFSPLDFLHAEAGEVVFQLNASFSQLKMVLIDLREGELEERHWRDLVAGESLSVPLSSSLTLLFWGGFIEGVPWEGHFIVAVDKPFSLELELPERVAPEGDFEIVVKADVEGEVPIFLSIRERLRDGVDQFERSWGPSATLQRELLSFVGDLEGGKVDYPVSLLLGKAENAEEGDSSLGSKEIQYPDGWEIPIPEEEIFDRTVFSDIIFVDRAKFLQFRAPNEQTSYSVDALALAGRHWEYAKGEIDISEATFAELLLPVFAKEGDALTGEVVLVTEESIVFVALARDGEPVELWEGERQIFADTPIDGGVAELQFDVLPGRYLLKVFDNAGEELKRVETEVHDGRKRRRRAMRMKILNEGEVFSKGDEQEKLAVILDFSERIHRVAKQIALQPSGNCEQEAARVRAAISWLGVVRDRQDAQEAMRFLKMGLEALSGMLLPQMGFQLYLDGGQDLFLGKEAVRHLWEVEILRQRSESLPFEVWFEDIAHLAKTAARGYSLQKLPARLESCRDAYRVFSLDGTVIRREEALQEVQQRLSLWEQGLEGIEDEVEERRERAYAAALLLMSEEEEDVRQGLRLADRLLGELGEEGLFYTNADNLALLALLEVFQEHLSKPEELAFQLDDDVYDASILEGGGLEFHSIKVLNGRLVVAYEVLLDELLDNFSERPELRVSFYRPSLPEKKLIDLEVGERLELLVKLPQGSEVGDLLEIYVPPALLYLGGDLEGSPLVLELRDCHELRLPFAAVEASGAIDGTIGPQHWGFRLRNFYRKRRGTTIWQQALTIFPYGQRRRGLREQLSRGWNKIFG